MKPAEREKIVRAGFEVLSAHGVRLRRQLPPAGLEDDVPLLRRIRAVDTIAIRLEWALGNDLPSKGFGVGADIVLSGDLEPEDTEFLRALAAEYDLASGSHAGNADALRRLAALLDRYIAGEYLPAPQ